jgi:tetratricopeptide (TPR) repeat protein
VRSWEQLVRESAAEPGAEHVEQGAVAPADDIDPISDKDLLREVLADEPPPSNIIMKDPSAGELPALKAESNDPSFSSFVLPPDLAATRPGDSSVLGHAPPAGSFTSDVWGSSSDVDLLRPSNSSSGLLQPTDEVANPPLAQPASGDSSKALGDAPLPGAESSAVDLGAHSAVDLPFPLGVDSTVGPASRRSHAHIDSPDSGTVDLMAAGEEFDVGLSDSTTSPSWAAAREDLPPTVPMVPAKARLMAWAGGGGAGLLVGVAACAVLWWAGVVPNQSAKPVASVPAADTSRYQAQVQAAEQARDDAAKKAEAETANAKRLTNQVAVLTTQSQKAASAVTQAKQARDRAAVLAAEVKDLEARQALLKQTSDKLATDKSTADAKAREAEAALANLRDRMAKAETDAKVAQDRADEASASLAAVQKKSAAATAEIARRLRLAPNASSAEMLAALDQALAGPATGEPPSTTVASRPPVALPPASPITNSVQASQASWSGIAAYRTGNAAAAERDFARLAASPEANAITFYFLGLSQRRQGHYAESEESFRRGWELEKSSRPSPAEVEAVFERLPPADRDAVNRHRR